MGEIRKEKKTHGEMVRNALILYGALMQCAQTS